MKHIQFLSENDRKALEVVAHVLGYLDRELTALDAGQPELLELIDHARRLSLALLISEASVRGEGAFTLSEASLD